MPNLKNILIFVAVGAVFVGIYFFYFKKPDTAPLTSIMPVAPMSGGVATTTGNTNIGGDFLRLLLSAKSIQLKTDILSDNAFKSLDGSHSIPLIPDGNEGRINPFAPIGSDQFTAPPSNTGASDQGDGSAQ